MIIKIVTDTITISELREIAKDTYVTMIKGVVDIEQEIIAFGGEYHMDANRVLISNGSNQQNVWGFNILFDKELHEWIEYTSLINIRPALGNRKIEVTDENLRNKMKNVIHAKIKL